MTQRKSRILQNVHEGAKDLYDLGIITIEDMREFDALCLPATVPDYTAEEIKAIRERLKISQPVFAAYIGVTKNTVVGWEQGVKRPAGSARRLIHLADRKGLEAIA